MKSYRSTRFRRCLLLAAATLLWGFFPAPAAQAVIVTDIGIDTDVADQRTVVLDRIGEESRQTDDAFVASGYMTVSPGWSTVQISFLAEGAGYRNDFGWFLFDYDGAGYAIIETGFLFEQIRETPVDELGNTTGSGQTGAVASGESFLLTAESGDSSYYVGWILENQQGDTFYTINELNENEEDHFGAAVMTGGLDGYYMGIEDLAGLGDQDYNDVIFYTNPDTGLSPNPSVVPEPGATALFLVGCLPALAFWWRRRRLEPQPSIRLAG